MAEKTEEQIKLLKRGTVEIFREAELAEKPMVEGSVPFERFSAVPYVPGVRIAAVGVVRIAPVACRGMGAAGPVVALRVEFFYDLRDKFVEQFAVIFPVHRSFAPAIGDKSHFNLIVTAPKRDAGVMAEPFDVVLKLGGYVFHKAFVKGRICRAGKHKILPDADTQFVAYLVEHVVFVDSAAPDP